MTKHLLIYLEANQAFFYGDELAAIEKVEIPNDIIRDLEIVNQDKFSWLIQAFLDTNQLLQTTVVLILSPAITFDKDISEFEVEQRRDEERIFFEKIPFRSTLEYHFIQQNKQVLIASNKDVVQVIKYTLEKKGFNFQAVVAMSAIQEIFPELKTNLDFDFILGKLDTLKQYNMLFNPDQGKNTVSSQQKVNGKKDNKRLYVMFGIFGFLIIILIIMTVNSFLPQKTLGTSHKTSSQKIHPKPIAKVKKNETVTESFSQQVQGVSIIKKIIPTFYTITTGDK